MSRRKSGHAEVDAHTGVVVGSDEAGFGPWAGPIIVCAVAAPAGWDDPRVKDSKKLSAKVREALYKEYRHDPRFVTVVAGVTPEEIDKGGAYKSLLLAHTTAIGHAYTNGALVVADGVLPINTLLSQTEGGRGVSLPKADNLVPECALASIIAKVTRDRIMAELDKQFPGYGFAKHAGYGTKQHAEALNQLGPCEAHRWSYQPIREVAARKGFISPRPQA